MGYSFDNSTYTAIVHATSVNTAVSAAVGAHVLHVKSWGVSGAACVTDVPVTIVPLPLTWVPSWAKVSKEIQSWTGWKETFDTGTGSGGSSAGATSVTSSLSLSGYARKFTTSYTNYGGERYWINFGNDSAPQNFLYDTWLYIASPSGGIANIEMDMNEVIWNGDTVIYGVQCDGYSNTWDYTANTGTRANYNDTWLHSNAWCNPRVWSANQWHHIQIAYSRDSSGYVTYKAIWFDGIEQDIYKTVPSAFSLNWGPALLTNFQIDGLGTYGSATVYLDHLTVYRW